MTENSSGEPFDVLISMHRYKRVSVLAGWQKSLTLNLVSGGVDPLQQGNGESSGLACAMHKCEARCDTLHGALAQTRWA